MIMKHRDSFRRSLGNNLLHFAVVAAGLVGIASACGTAGYGLYLRDLSLDGELADANRLFRDASAMRAKLDQLRARYDEVRGDVDRRLARIPASATNSDVLRPVSAACESNGLTIKIFRPQSVEQHAKFSEQVIAVQAIGRYEALCRTLASIARLPWYSRVSRLTLTPQDAGDGDMQVELQLAIATNLKTQL